MRRAIFILASSLACCNLALAQLTTTTGNAQEGTPSQPKAIVDGRGRLSISRVGEDHDILLPGSLNQISADYVNPNILGSTGFYPHQIPHFNRYQSNAMRSASDFFYNEQHDLTILGTSAFTLKSAGFFAPNYGSDARNLYLYGAAQGGGFHTNNYIAHSTGDTVYDTAYILARGVGEGFHEGMEMYRHFMSFNFAVPQGEINLLGFDAHGREKIQLTSGSDFDQFGSDNILIDYSKKQSPAGNVTGVSVCTDSRFMCLTVDHSLATNLDRMMGGAIHQATIVAGADMRKYDANCPTQVVAPDWGTTNIGGTNISVNPYAADLAGEGSKTSAMCVTLSGDLSSINAGTTVSIWGAHENWEITKVTRKADATHIVIPLNFPHDPGEVVSWGSGPGWGVSTEATTIPAHTLDNVANPQTRDLHLVYPVIGWDSARKQILIYVNSAAAGTELKMNIYPGTSPLTPGVYTPIVKDGVVTAIASNNNTYNLSNTQSGVQTMLPPPAYTLDGSSNCAVKPTLHFVVESGAGYGPGYAAVLDKGGSGCPSDLTIVPQSSYPNPIILFPLTRIYRIQDPNSGDYRRGYLLTHALAAANQWTKGDWVEMTPHWQQYASGNEQYSYSPYVRHSRRFGPAVTEAIMFPQDGPGNGPLWDRYSTNQTPSWYYFGDASTDYLPSASKPYYAQGTPPIWRGIGGQWGGILDVKVPPTAGTYGALGEGYLFHVGCDVLAQDGPANEPPCRRSTNRIFPPFEVLRVDGLHGRKSFAYDDKGGAWNFTGNSINLNGQSVCLDNGTGCSPSYTLKFQAPPSGLQSGTVYYIGEPSLLTTNNGVSYRAPANCLVNAVTASEIVATGNPPSGEEPQVTLYDLTTNTPIVHASFSWSGTGQNVYTWGNGNKQVAAGDLLQIQISTPIWATPPSGTLAFSATVYCK